MNEMLIQNNRGREVKPFSILAGNNRQPSAIERSQLVQRYREINKNHRRREVLFGCVMH